MILQHGGVDNWNRAFGHNRYNYNIGGFYMMELVSGLGPSLCRLPELDLGVE